MMPQTTLQLAGKLSRQWSSLPAKAVLYGIWARSATSLTIKPLAAWGLRMAPAFLTYSPLFRIIVMALPPHISTISPTFIHDSFSKAGAVGKETFEQATSSWTSGKVWKRWTSAGGSIPSAVVMRARRSRPGISDTIKFLGSPLTLCVVLHDSFPVSSTSRDIGERGFC